MFLFTFKYFLVVHGLNSMGVATGCLPALGARIMHVRDMTGPPKTNTAVLTSFARCATFVRRHCTCQAGEGTARLVCTSRAVSTLVPTGNLCCLICHTMQDPGGGAVASNAVESNQYLYL